MKRFFRNLFTILILEVIIISLARICPSYAKADAKLSESSVSVDTEESFTLSYKTKKDINDIYISVYAVDEKTGSEQSASYRDYNYEEKGSGKRKYVFTFYKGGTYRIEISGVHYTVSDDYWWYYEDARYSASCKVTVRTVGIAESNIAVLKGRSKEIEIVNAKLISTSVIEDDDWWGEEDGEIKLKGTKIKGIETGEVKVSVKYKTEKGEEKEKEVRVYVTDPEYEPRDGYVVVANGSFRLNISGASEYSEFSFKSSDENVLKLSESSYGDVYYLRPVGAGTAKITFKVDGKEFKDTITVYDPKLSCNVMLLKLNKKKTLTVKGLPEDVDTKFYSDDQDVISVKKDGTIKAKAMGNACVEVRCGDMVSFTCSVTVYDNMTAMNAANAAYSHIGATYSQDKRMSEGYYDCSSLAWRSYNEAGIKLVNDSYAPTAAGLAEGLEKEGYKISDKALDADELKPGDLLFYSSGSNGRYLNIDHVAMYYGANYSGGSNYGMIVHARSGGVQTGVYDNYIPSCIVMICRPLQ